MSIYPFHKRSPDCALETVFATSASNSDSLKGAAASCPAGKMVVGTGYDIIGGKSSQFPNILTDVVVSEVMVYNGIDVSVEAIEEEPTTASWSVKAQATCATAS